MGVELPRTISETWAILREDGSVAGDGECSLDGFAKREWAEDELNRAGEYLREINRSPLRIARVRLTEIQ